jgi:hypothetical protein
MILVRAGGNTPRDSSPSDTFPIKNPISSGLGLNPGVRYERVTADVCQLVWCKPCTISSGKSLPTFGRTAVSSRWGSSNMYSVATGTVQSYLLHRL